MLPGIADRVGFTAHLMKAITHLLHSSFLNLNHQWTVNVLKSDMLQLSWLILNILISHHENWFSGHHLPAFLSLSLSLSVISRGSLRWSISFHFPPGCSTIYQPGEGNLGLSIDICPRCFYTIQQPRPSYVFYRGAKKMLPFKSIPSQPDIYTYIVQTSSHYIIQYETANINGHLPDCHETAWTILHGDILD